MTELARIELQNRFTALSAEEQFIAAQCFPTEILLTEIYNRLKDGENFKASIVGIVGGVNG